MNKKTILVVEDEMGPRESLKMILGAHYQIELAENGLKAMEILERQSIDGITMDLRMPGPSGIDALKQIKKRWPAIQVLVITGYATLKTALDAIRHGAFNYLQKPFDIDELVDVMQKMVAKKNQMEGVGGLNLPEREYPVASPSPPTVKSAAFAFSDFENIHEAD